MNTSGFFKGIIFVVVFASGLSAETAQEIVDAAAKVYAEAGAYSGRIDSRIVPVVFSTTPKTGVASAEEKEAPRFTVGVTRYRRLQIKMRRPYDYLLGYQQWFERPHSGDEPGSSENTGGFPGQSPSSPGSSPDAKWQFIARTDSSLPQQGSFIGTKFVTRPLQANEFTSLVQSKLGGDSSREDVVLRYLQSQPMDPGTVALSLVEPELIGRENIRGMSVYRIVGKTVNNDPVMLWIQSDKFLIIRSIVQRTNSRTMYGQPVTRMGPNGVPFTPPQYRPPIGMVSVTETFYNDQELNPKFGGGAFAIVAPAQAMGLPTPESLGFSSVADLVKLAEVTPPKRDPAAAETSAPGVEPGATAVPTPVPTPTPAPISGQALSVEQMEGIVLIDAEDSTATGFMTRIKDVDFVVTNLHVLGDGKKFTLKTLRGETIPVLGIYGAIGSDIAILRISARQGDLKLTDDVFKSTKIGDKVVVVGNRLGGGVATQTAGNVMGVGPTRVEVNANFEPGNSGSPIVNLGTGEVIGVATYAETRRVNVSDESASSSGGSSTARTGTVEKRWFGYRLDCVSKWEQIDLTKWHAQTDRIDKFREFSEGLHALVRFNFRKARENSKLGPLLDAFDVRYNRVSNDRLASADEVKGLMRTVRSMAEDGVREMTNGDYYDYFRTSLYWETSIPSQLEYRNALINALKKYEANSAGYVSRLRNGG